MPQSPESVQASAARIRNAGRPPVCRKKGLMSGVLTKRCGRKKSETCSLASSVKYEMSSYLVLCQVKYV